MTLSLFAVFMPILRMGGILGRLLKEFAVLAAIDAVAYFGFLRLLFYTEMESGQATLQLIAANQYHRSSHLHSIAPQVSPSSKASSHDHSIDRPAPKRRTPAV